MGLKIVRIFYFFMIIVPRILGNKINSNFVRDYFLHQGVKQIAVFACWNLFGLYLGCSGYVNYFNALQYETSMFVDRVDFSKNVMQLDLRLSYASTESDDTDLTIFLKVNYYKLGIFLDLDCPQSEEILHQITRNRIPYNESYFWLMTTSSNVVPYKILYLLPLSINAEMCVALEKEKNAYTLYDVYNPSYKHGGKINITHMGSWDVDRGLTNLLTQYKYLRRANLNKMFLNFSIVVDHPPTKVDMDTYLTTPIDKHYDTMHRYNYALTRQLRDYYNFTMNLMRGTTWGYKVNGSFNGILGDFIKGTVDIGATPFRFKMERLDVMEYTVQTWYASPKVVFRHPKKNDLRNQFFRPFTREVWFFTTIVGFLNWILLYLTVKVEQHYDKKIPRITLDTHPASEIALIATAAICQQGLSDGPRLYSGRVVFMSLFLWALILYQFYSASIVGSLLTAPPRFITTPQALLESSLELGAEDIAYNYDFFATDPDPVVAELNRKKLSVNKYRKKAPYFNPKEGLKKVQKGGFAFQVDMATGYRIIEETFNEDEICDLQEIVLFRNTHTAVGTAKHSPFKKMVTYGMRQIVEKGMARRLRHIWQHRRPMCPESHSALPTPVALKEFSPALFMFATGCAIAIFVMLVENLLRKYWYFLKQRRAALSPALPQDSSENSVKSSKIDFE